MAATREAPGASGARAPEALYGKLSPGPGKSAAEVADHQRSRLFSAMIEIVGDDGYEAVSVRRVSRLAGVSTATFYDHFEGKEECFLRTYELIVRRAATRIGALLRGDGDYKERLRLAIAAFTQAIVDEPRSARLALVEASGAGAAAMGQMRATETLFEAMLNENVTRGSSGVRMPSALVKGIVSGITGVARARLLFGREWELPSMAGELSSWALSFQNEAVVELKEVRSQRGPAKVPLDSRVSPLLPEKRRWTDDNRPLILTAVAKLAAAKSYYQLTVPRIRAAAGVSRRCFDAHFQNVDDCFLEALELRVAAALELAVSHTNGRTWDSDVYLALEALCGQLAADSVLSAIALSEAFIAGPSAMRRREEMTAAIAKRLRASVPPGQDQPTQIAAEASIDAIWAVLHRHVITGQTQRQLPRASVLAYLMLAPSVGAPRAIRAIKGGRVQFNEALAKTA